MRGPYLEHLALVSLARLERVLSEWLAVGLVTVGALVAVIGAAGATAAFFGYLRARKSLPDDRQHRLIAALEFVYLVLLATALTGAGVASLLIGEVIGYGIPAWSVALPFALLLMAILMAWFVRRQRQGLRDSD